MRVTTVIAHNVDLIEEKVNLEIDRIELCGGKVVNVSLAVNPNEYFPVYAMVLYSCEVDV